MRTTGAVREFTDDPLPDDVLERILDNAQVRTQRRQPAGRPRRSWFATRQPARSWPSCTIPGAKRYIAQRRNGESPWNPLHPCGVDDATVRRPTEPPMAVTAARRPGGARGLPRPRRGRSDRPGPRPHRRDQRRVGVPVRVEHPAGRAQRGLRRRARPRWRSPRSRACKELLGIPDDYAVAAVLPLGKPVKQVTKLTRKPVAEIATRERFDGDAALALPCAFAARLHLLLVRPHLLQRARVDDVGDRHVRAGLAVVTGRLAPALRRHAVLLAQAAPGRSCAFCSPKPGNALSRRSTSAPSGSPAVHSAAASPS